MIQTMVRLTNEVVEVDVDKSDTVIGELHSEIFHGVMTHRVDDVHFTTSQVVDICEVPGCMPLITVDLKNGNGGEE